jgi:hypothetical protein
VHGGPGHLKSQGRLDLTGFMPFGTEIIPLDGPVKAIIISVPWYVAFD